MAADSSVQVGFRCPDPGELALQTCHVLVLLCPASFPTEELHVGLKKEKQPSNLDLGSVSCVWMVHDSIIQIYEREEVF